jgi:hypothetical protein
VAARFRVIEQHEIDAGEQLQQIVALAIDPVVHRVTGNEPRRTHLAQDIELKNGINVAEEDHSEA